MGLVITMIVAALAIGLVIGLKPSAETIGSWGESITAKRLGRLRREEYWVLSNLLIRDLAGETTQIDHVVVSKYGIFVIETKCYKGWIFGHENSREWTQSLYTGRRWFGRSEQYKFRNPIKQNWRHIYALSEVLELPKRMFHNVVVFSGDAEFKSEVPDNVMYDIGVVGYIESFKDEVLSRVQCERIVEKLVRLNLSESKQEMKVHVENLYNDHVATPTAKVPACPKCGSPMKLRHRRTDDAPFFGCSRYPKCRGIVQVNRQEV